MEIQLSTKNTKAEILEAYETLLKNVQQAKADVPKQVQEEKRKKEIVEKVTGITMEGIAKSMVDLKSLFNNSIEEVNQQLSEEFKKLEEIRTAIAVEKQTLEELYSLKTNTDSLAAMLLAQKEKKESFEKMMKEKEEAFSKEISDKKAQWEQEKANQKTAEKEYLDELAKRRKREEEEYRYNLKITRQKDEDGYNSKKELLEKELIDKKASFEQEISARESEIKNAESELVELRKTNAEFPEKLNNILKEKEEQITLSLRTKYEFDIKLIEKQNEAECRLKDQMISSLQEKIKELQIQVKEYAEKANRAEAGVKDIAVKAIENASKIRMFTKSEKEEA